MRLDFCRLRKEKFLSMKGPRLLIAVFLIFIFTGCEKWEEHHYVYSASAALYNETNNDWTVHIYGPKEVSLDSYAEALSFDNVEHVYRRLVGEISISNHTIPSPSQDINDIHASSDNTIKIPYNTFVFGYLHVEYHDQFSSNGKTTKKDFFLEPTKTGVDFLDQPHSFDPAIVYAIVSSARVVR